MEAEYGVGITNRYAFLVDDVEELEVLEKKKDEKVAQPVKKNVKKVVSVPNAKDNKELKAKTAKSAPSIETQKGSGRDDPSRERGGSRGRGGRGGAERPNANAGYKSDDFNDPEGAGEGFEVAGGRGMRSSGRGRGGMSRGGGRPMYGQEDRGNKENYNGADNFGGRGGGRGNGIRRGSGYQPRNNFDSNGGADENGYEDSRVERGNGGAGGREFFARGRGPRGGGRGGRRDYDRQSGSDKSSVKPMDKREGGGAHNWGSYKDDDDVKAETNDEKVDEDGNADELNNGHGAGDGDATVDTAEKEENGTQLKTPLIEQEPEPKTLTLGEWKAMQQPRTTPQFNIRKPNDGEDPTKWKHLVLRRKNNLDEDEDQYEEGEDIWVPQRAGRQQRITDIGFHFEDDRPNDRGFRRGPKQFRTGGRENGGQNDRQFGRMREPRPPKVDDENDFPTL